MVRTAELQDQLTKFVCGFFFWGIILAVVCQIGVTSYRWSIETERQDLWIARNDRRYNQFCIDTTQIYDLDFMTQCREFDEIRNQSASTLAMVKLAKEWQLCDAEQGGCRGVMGLFIGGIVILIGILYMFKRAPDYLKNFQERRENRNVNEFMYTRPANSRFG